jgi:cellulose synthase/poly-beta-1,6-N-acetylglucosamine synthase-like glycosyltransferase
MISTHVIKKGFLIKYAPDAQASEKASVNIIEEKKRKVRIAAGSFQALFRNIAFINPLKYPMFSFQFFSHKILRWFVLPISLFLIPFLNVLMLAFVSQNPIYIITLLVQTLLLIAIIAGWRLKDKQISAKWVFISYYLFMMNISIVQGFIRYIRGRQNVKWDKSLRQT